MEPTYGLSGKALGRTKKTVEKVLDSRSLVPQGRGRGGIIGSGKPVEFDTFNFETEDDGNGNQVNAHVVGNANKKVKVRSDYFDGIVLPGDEAWAIKYKGELYAVGCIRPQVRVVLDEDMGETSPAAGTMIGHDYQVSVYPQNDFTKMKSGMTVSATLENEKYYVTGMKDFHLSGTYEGGMLGGYPARLVAGQYNVTGSGLATGLGNRGTTRF